MKMALLLAKKVDPFPNPRVGAVLVKDDVILGKGFHKAAGLPHAEIEAIQNAKEKAADPNIAKGATLYITLEPCSHTIKRTSPCTEAIIANGISKVVFANTDPNPLVSGADVLRASAIEVVGPVAAEEERKINGQYIANISKKPFCAIKMAMSADGKTATKSGDSKWISGKDARNFVQKMRSEFDGVMVGAGTIKADNPRLTSRIKDGRDPYRIIVDSDLCIPQDSNVLQNKDGKTIIATTEKAPKNRISEMENVFICGKEKVNMKKLICGLNAMGIKKILLEGGSELNASALDAGIVNKLYIFIAPKIIGGQNAKGVVGGVGIEKMTQARKIKLVKTKKIGDDLLLEFDI